MKLLLLLMVAAAMLMSTPARAAKRVTAAGVTLEPPARWKVVPEPDGGARLVNPEGDVVWRVFASEPATDLHAWFDDAWAALASAHASVQQSPPDELSTTSGLAGRAGAGVMVDASGKKHILLLAAFSDGKRVSPMLLEFASEASLGRATDVIAAAATIALLARSPMPKAAFARGGWRYPLGGAVAPVAPAPVAGPGPASPGPPATTAASLPFLGKWSVGQSAYSSGYSVSYGSRLLQYDFVADGTYTFHSEAWGGSANPNWRYIIEEKGAWSAAGDQLTVAPTSATGVVRDLKGNAVKQGGPGLEKVTYRFQTTYFSGLQETQLVLTPPTATARDGAFASNPSFPGSYLLKNNYKPAFRFAPP